jgi:hypothetical protein
VQKRTSRQCARDLWNLQSPWRVNRDPRDLLPQQCHSDDIPPSNYVMSEFDCTRLVYLVWCQSQKQRDSGFSSNLFASCGASVFMAHSQTHLLAPTPLPPTITSPRPSSSRRAHGRGKHPFQMFRSDFKLTLYRFLMQCLYIYRGCPRSCASGTINLTRWLGRAPRL